MKIGILTFHRAYNCGAALQAWALKTVLERMGHEVEFPNCNSVGLSKRWQLPWTNPEKHGLGWVRSLIGRTYYNLRSIPSEDVLRSRYRRFRREHWAERDCTVADLEKHYDLLVVGSDQVWSVDHGGADAPLFFAENLPSALPKIAYAASCGDNPLADGKIERVSAAVGRFSCVSVRENQAQRQLSRRTDKTVDVVLDPTLLLTAEDYDEIAAAECPRGEYLFMYTLFAAPFFVDVARTLARRLGVRAVIAPCYQYTRCNAPKGMTYSISPDRLVSYARRAKYVLAGSFHGTVMGTVFNKPFLSLREHADQCESRPAALLNAIGCPDRLATPETPLDEMERLLRTPLSESVRERIDIAAAKSKAWLAAAVGRSVRGK